MATLVLTAVGTAIGGPFGGALGAFVGRSLDSAILGAGNRKGPRLKDLAVTTSSYGAVLPRQYGKIRAAGTVIWATDLKEAKKTSSGKGKPKVTTYSYTVSFAVALSSNEIAGIGRIWADGNLLRGGDGDLKVGGSLRVYQGTGSQLADPLIASDVGPDQCSGFRDLAYVVFEELQLADFGNRIPALTFEIIASDGSISLSDVLGDELEAATTIALDGMIGLSHEGGSYSDLLQSISNAYPIACDGSGGLLTIADPSASRSNEIATLPPAVVGEREDFGSITGVARERANDDGIRQLSLRYYDMERDYQPGLQRSRARPGKGETATIELPATLDADTARLLADSAAARERGLRDTMTYRVAEIDPALRPGAVVSVPGQAGLWVIDGWEWRKTGVELELHAIPPALSAGQMPAGSSGETLPPPDLADGATAISAFGLPWDGTGDPWTASIFAATSSTQSGWRGAALFADYGDGQLHEIGTSGRTRATMGTVENLLAPSTPHLIDRESELIVDLLASDMILADAEMTDISLGANRARVGSEVIQFMTAQPLGGTRWRLSCLLRGRGGTESQIGEHQSGEPFVLIDDAITALDSSVAINPTADSIVALGNGDAEPAIAKLEDPLISLTPYAPVHGALVPMGDGSVALQWVRRSRGGFAWPDGLDVPLHEATESYEIRHTIEQATNSLWLSEEPTILFSAEEWSQLISRGGQFEIRQSGTYGRSRPLIVQFAT